MPESKCGAAEKVAPAASPAAEKPADIAGNISFHATYSPHFVPLNFGPEQAFYATAESVRDHLIQVSTRRVLIMARWQPARGRSCAEAQV